MIQDARSIFILALLVLALAGSGCLGGDDAEPVHDPVATFTFQPEQPMPGDPVEFLTTDSQPSAEQATYEWDFKDGNTAEGENVTHTFEDEGEYAVSLVVTIPNGDYDSALQTISVGGTPEGSLNETYEGSFTVGAPVENDASMTDHAMNLDVGQADVEILLEATDSNAQFDMTLLDSGGTEVASASGADEATIEEGELEADSYTLRIHMTMGAQASYMVTAIGTAMPGNETATPDEGEPPAVFGR